MNEGDIHGHFQELWKDVENDTYPNERPLLAHYTSIATLESILRSDELWFSNPLLMNDTEEMRFGMIQGRNAFHSSKAIEAACKSSERYEALTKLFDDFYEVFSNDGAFDTYVFCLSKHDPNNQDGRLSMWRGYGGNGHGAAIVIDTSKLEPRPGHEPLIISKVRYMSTQDRNDWLSNKMQSFAELIGSADLPDSKFQIPIFSLFERLKMFALFTKHVGFQEEEEWRAVYLKERDIQNTFTSMLDYAVVGNTIQPKFRLKVLPIPGYSDKLSLVGIIDRIILGPMASGELHRLSVRRMLNQIGKSALVEKVLVSQIPYRP